MREPSIRIHYVIAVARALVALGEPATPLQVYDWIKRNRLRRTQIPPEGMDPEQHYQREVRFARQELRDWGLLSSVRKRWQITDMDGMLDLTPAIAQDIIRQNRRKRDVPRAAMDPGSPNVADPARSSQPIATTGPRPSEWVAKTSRVDGSASTYALRFGITDLWKIGFASDVSSRLAAINRHIPTEIIGTSWEIVFVVPWPNQLAAYAMEQEVLAVLSSERTIFERVRCTPEHLSAAWKRARATIGRQQPPSLSKGAARQALAP